MSRLGRSQPVPPIAWHGFVNPGPGPVGTTPRWPVVVEQDRPRRPPPPAVVICGPAVTTAPAVAPPRPLVVLQPERPRPLPLPAVATRGFVEDTAPRPPLVVEPVRRRVLPEIVSLRGLYAPITFTDSGSATITLTGISAENQTHASAATATVTLDGTGSELFVPASAGPPDAPRHTVHIISHI